jgi:hypothetical protein
MGDYVDCLERAIDPAVIDPEEIRAERLDSFSCSANTDARRPQDRNRCVIHEDVGAFDLRLDRVALAEDRAPPKDH